MAILDSRYHSAAAAGREIGVQDKKRKSSAVA
jgi:hypothetical protein